MNLEDSNDHLINNMKQTVNGKKKKRQTLIDFSFLTFGSLVLSIVFMILSPKEYIMEESLRQTPEIIIASLLLLVFIFLLGVWSQKVYTFFSKYTLMARKK